MIEPDSLSIDGRRLAYVDEGTGPPVVLIHGASGNIGDWTSGPSAALQPGYRVIAFDRPGLARSDPAPDPFSLASQAGVMAKGVAELGLSRPILVGQSYGGAVALRWAIDRPDDVAGLVLISAPTNIWPGSAGLRYDILGAPLFGRAFSALFASAVGPRQVAQALRMIFAPQPVPDGYIEAIEPKYATSASALHFNSSQITVLKDEIEKMIPHYPALTMPIERIHGLADTIVPYAQHIPAFMEVLPQTGLVALEGIGHMPHHARRDILRAAVDRIAATRDPDTPAG